MRARETGSRQSLEQQEYVRGMGCHCDASLGTVYLTYGKSYVEVRQGKLINPVPAYDISLWLSILGVWARFMVLSMYRASTQVYLYLLWVVEWIVF